MMDDDTTMHSPSDIGQDNKSVEDSQSVANSQLIKEATAAALQDAVAMKRSDSILSVSDHGEEDQEENELKDMGKPRNSSLKYAEDASFEASLVSPSQYRLQSSDTNEVVDLHLSSSQQRNDDDQLFSPSASSEMETSVFLGISNDFESFAAPTLGAPLETIPATSDSEDENDVEMTPSNDDVLSQLLESYGLKIPDTRSTEFTEEAILLHALFEGFCKPSLDISSVQRIIDMERKESKQPFDSVDLPVDVVIQKPCNTLFRLLGRPLFKLPRYFTLGLFRILLRLLTSDTDEDYDYETLIYCPWYDEIISSSISSPKNDSNLKKYLSVVDKSFNRDRDARKVDHMYTMVRFQRNWEAPVSQILELLRVIIQDKRLDYLQAPVARLLGLLCTCGVSVDDLRRILALTTESKDSPKMQLLLVRALKNAAAGASRSSLLAGKASPRCFFSFVSGPGITRNISLENKPQWPFRNDFGMALWFRAEQFSRSSTLLRATDQAKNGIEVSLLPLDNYSTSEEGTSLPTTTVLAISILEAGKVKSRMKVGKCILHARVWYHVVVRHRKSGLKGVFSLSSREQLSIILDGKLMLTEPFKFPVIPEPVKSLTLQMGSNFDGQTGSLYVFHDNVSQATFKALYEVTAGTVYKTNSTPGEWDSRRGDLVKKSKVLDLNMRHDDVEEIVLSPRSGSKENMPSSAVIDLDEENESTPLSKSAFNSRLYIVWDPRRTESNIALELHAGAHAKINENVQSWTVDGAQDVISSIGGMQALLLVFRSLLSGNIENEWGLANTVIEQVDSPILYQRAVLCSIVPDLFLLLAAFIRDHPENAREILRFGGMDIVEQLLQKNKKNGKSRSCLPASSLVEAPAIFPSLSTLLVKSVMELHSASSHYVGLETKTFTRLFFNLPLWFGGSESGISLYATLLPVLASDTSKNPEKVRDCVGIKDIMHCAKFLIEMEDEDSHSTRNLFARSVNDVDHVKTKLNSRERSHILDVYLGMTFQILSVGSNIDGFSQFIHLLSHYLEIEWSEASREATDGTEGISRKGVREQRYMFTKKASTILLLLLQIRPPVPGLYESFAAICGSAQDAVAWVLSAMVNSFCDHIRSVGVRCVIHFIEMTATSPDLPLTLEKALAFEVDKSKAQDGRTIQENTRNLISNVQQGFLSSVRSRLLSNSMLTARVVYKLLWHLLKSHRHRMGIQTQSSLMSMVFDRESENLNLSLPSLRKNFLIADDVLQAGVTIDMLWVQSVLQDTNAVHNVSIRNSLGTSTIMRLLRFLPDHYIDQWLSNLFHLSSHSLSLMEALSSSLDWQPSLFQFLSELVEKIAASTNKKETSNDKTSSNKNEATIPALSSQMPVNVLERRLYLALELYASFLGHRIREGGDQGLIVVEDAASLQRICLNGQEVFSLIMSRLFVNLSKFGVVSVNQSSNLSTESETEDPTFVLKNGARLVTNSILSNGARGMAMPVAVSCWRCLRYLTAITVAIDTRLGFGVAELFDYRNQVASAIDEVSGGLLGIRLSDGEADGISSGDLCQFYERSKSNSSIDVDDASTVSMRERQLFRRICVTLSAQILSLLDVFIFPDSLDASLPASQLHGLALVRSTEARIGSSQGPLLTSLIRLSLLLLCHLEPCSVKMLQCSSRLRCFLHWIFELIREAEALEGYSAAFNKLTAPFDRLILAIMLQCHRTLGRCASLLKEIESTPFETYFDTKETQKKSYRRLLRVTVELRDILVTIFERRNDVLKSCLSQNAFDALRSCLEVASTSEPKSTLAAGSQKEVLVRALLHSSWVTKFQDVDIRGRVSLPEQLQTRSISSQQHTGISAIEDLLKESDGIVVSFEKSLNASFEKYLEAQRKWAETGAVRDLECEGDATLKRLSQKHSYDLGDFLKTMSMRNHASDERWKGIDGKITELWRGNMHWKLSKHPDQLGRRILLVRNRQFDDHGVASYDLQMGKEREKEEKEREERLRKKQELSDLMKRNSEAFTSQSLDIDEDEEIETSTLASDSIRGRLDTAMTFDSEAENERERLDSMTLETDLDTATETVEIGAIENIELVGSMTTEIDNDEDAWAKGYIWTDGESVVARFDSVLIVTLQYLVEGKLLLTTHGLYFHQIGEDTNVVTKESTSSEFNDRRWRLSRLTEVHGRRYMLRAQALELFFSDSHELFLNFLNGTKERDRFYAKLRNSCKVPMLFSPKSLNPRSHFKRTKLTELWQKRRISNFEYLMALNRMAGRTFNDIAQYPVMPWILSDYTSERIDLSDSRVYRDLTKPVGALNPDRLSQLLERYNELEQFGFAENEKFLYGSHYSSPGVILHYLIRQEPFTSMAIDLQSGRFDCPDRLFFDLAESWKSCNTSSSDVKELIPEFFTLPEMLLNTNKFPLGKTQQGRPVDNVGLPPWAKGSVHEFVKIHRLALESEYVSRNLHHWVDLIFGFKQRGIEAEKAHNVFHHLSYEGSVDLDKITDELDRNAAESHIQNFGQTPSQLLVRDPHPPRCSAEECWEPLINNLSSTVRLRCQTPAKQFGGKEGGCGSVIKIYVQADSVTVIYSDLKVGKFKWAPKQKTGRLKCDTLRALPNRGVSNSRSVLKRGSAAPQTMDGSGSRLAVGNWSFAMTIGGYEKEQLRRKAIMPSRLASAKDALYTDPASLIVSCGYWDNTVKVHSTDMWRLECSDSGGHRGAIRCLAAGQDGGLLVTGGEDCTCRVWVVDHPDMAVALSNGYVQTALGHSTDSDQVLSCCHVLWGHQTAVTCVDLSSELDIVVSGSLGGRICVHTLRRGEFVRSITPSPYPVDKITLDNHGRMVAHASERLYLYTINGTLICSVNVGERIHDMKITGEVLVTGGDRCHVYMRDLTSLKILSGLDLSKHGPIRSLTLTSAELNPLPQHLFIGSDDGMVSIVDRAP